jgi:hypothetical protein
MGAKNTWELSLARLCSNISNNHNLYKITNRVDVKIHSAEIAIGVQGTLGVE